MYGFCAGFFYSPNPITPFLLYQLKPFFYLGIPRHTFSAEWRAPVSTFFLLSSLPFPLSRLRVLIAIQGARRRNHLREVFSRRRCTPLSRIMKLESRPICGPYGAIFFNYSCRSSAPSGGRRGRAEGERQGGGSGGGKYGALSQIRKRFSKGNAAWKMW